uniref:Uncharacterized protein n=1 Tax=Steinernema glaseri TaxID=37863 RepID=A0A1I7Y9S2_9BILA
MKNTGGLLCQRTGNKGQHSLLRGMGNSQDTHAWEERPYSGSTSTTGGIFSRSMTITVKTCYKRTGTAKPQVKRTFWTPEIP